MPWDVARRTVQLSRATNTSGARSTAALIILRKVREDGISTMFHNPYSPARTSSMHDTTIRRRVYSMLKTVGRVGPWGVGFVVWEAYHTNEYR